MADITIHVGCGLADIDGGHLLERINKALTRIAQDIHDEPDWEEPRTLGIALVCEPMWDKRTGTLVAKVEAKVTTNLSRKTQSRTEDRLGVSGTGFSKWTAETPLFEGEDERPEEG